MESRIKKRLRDGYFVVFPQYVHELEQSLKGMKTLLDVGCGDESPIAQFKHTMHATGIDIYAADLKKSKKRRVHKKYVTGNVMDIHKLFAPKSFDVVLASDLIEHLTKKDGLLLLKRMESLAKKRVVVFTPNGFLPQDATPDNPYQLHRSGWSVDEMRKRGYHVVGIGGWKPLRTTFAAIRYKPHFFWQLVSDITQYGTKHTPKHAFQLLCIKDMTKK